MFEFQLSETLTGAGSETVLWYPQSCRTPETQTQWHMKKKTRNSYLQLWWTMMLFYELFWNKDEYCKKKKWSKIFFYFCTNFRNLEINFLNKIFFYFCFLHRIKRYSDSNLQAFTNTKTLCSKEYFVLWIVVYFFINSIIYFLWILKKTLLFLCVKKTVFVNNLQYVFKWQMPPKLTSFFNIFYNFLFYIFIWEKFKNSLNKIIRFSKLHFLVFVEFYRENLIFVLYYAYLLCFAKNINEWKKL